MSFINQRAASATRHFVLAAVMILFTPSPAFAQQAGTVRLSMGDAARLAVQRNADASAARERATQAEAHSRQVRASLLPTLSADAQMGTRTFNTASLGLQLPTQPGQTPPFDANGEVQGPVNTVDLRFRITQSLIDLPALARWRASIVSTSASQADARAAGETTAKEGALAYLRVARAGAQLAARLADSVLAGELLAIAREQLTAGTAIALDVTRAQSRLAAAAAELISIRSERSRAELDLLQTLALPVDMKIEMKDSLTLPASTDVSVTEDDAVRTALRRRGTVQAAEAHAGEARLQVAAARAERLPRVALFGDHGTVGNASDHLLGTYSYGVQVSIPMLDGFRREARIDEGRARLREAELRWRDTRLRTEVEVRSALLDLSATRERVTAAQVQLALAEQEVSQARERFRAGVAGNSDVIAASLSLNSARDVYVDALAAYHIARVALASAQGSTTALP